MSQQKPPKKKSPLKNAAILTGIGFEMGAIIYLSVQGGKWLDTENQNEKNIFTVIATLLGVAISIWLVLQQLKRIKY